MPAHSIRTDDNDARFFAALENGHTVGNACRAAGYTRQVAYRWRQQDAEFDKKWRAAMAIAGDLLEEEADRRGRDGYDEPVFFQGEQAGVKRKYSDALLLARLKAVRPELYRERIAMPANDQRQVTVVIRALEAEGAMLKLVKENKLLPSDLPEELQARLQEELAIPERSGE